MERIAGGRGIYLKAQVRDFKILQVQTSESRLEGHAKKAIDHPAAVASFA